MFGKSKDDNDQLPSPCNSLSDPQSQSRRNRVSTDQVSTISRGMTSSAKSSARAP